MKLIPIAIIVVVVVALVVGAYFVGKGNKQELVPQNTTTTISNTLPMRTTIIREHVPARIDTIWIDKDVPYEVASYSEIIDTNKVWIDLNIKYDEHSNEFDVRHNIFALRDSIYTERLVDRFVQHKPKLIAPAIGMSAGFREKALNNASIDAGIVVRGKYQLGAFVDTDKRYGVRMGMIWD